MNRQMALPATRPELANVDGSHLSGEWRECEIPAATLNDVETLRLICICATKVADMQMVGDAFHQFTPQGVIGTVRSAESVLAIHTWPESGLVTIDIHVRDGQANSTKNALRLYNLLKWYFLPAKEIRSEAALMKQPAEICSHAACTE